MDRDVQNFTKIQKILANFLGLLIISSWAWDAVYAIVSVATLMEIVEVNPAIYINVYVPISMCLVLLWIVCHRWFMRIYATDVSRGEGDKVTSTDLSRVNTLQATKVLSCLLLVVTSVQFLGFYHGPIGKGDNHVVHGGMDTKSPLYTFFLLVTFQVITVAMDHLTYLPFLVSLYFEDFHRDIKPRAI